MKLIQQHGALLICRFYDKQAKMDVVVTFDLSKGLATQSLRVYDSEGRLKLSGEVKQWTRINDMWLPQRCMRIMYVPLLRRNEMHVMATETLIIEKMSLDASVPSNIISKLLNQLPKGTEIFDAQLQLSYFHGYELSDADIAKLADATKRFLKGEIPLKELEQVIHPQKRLASRWLCGPYSLAILAHMQGIHASVKEWANLSGADEKGITTMAGLVRAAHKKGLKLIGVRMPIKMLSKLTPPAIIHTKLEHFALFLGFSNGKVVLIDPPAKVVTIPIEDFAKIWTGVAIIVHQLGR